MAYITGVDRIQGMLLPESLEDYIASDHRVRFLDAFVDGLTWPGAALAGRNRQAQGVRRLRRAICSSSMCGVILTTWAPAAGWKGNAPAIWKSSG